MTDHFGAELARIERAMLTLPQRCVLANVEAAAGPVSVEFLAERLDTTVRGARQTAESLVRRGFVERAGDGYRAV